MLRTKSLTIKRSADARRRGRWAQYAVLVLIGSLLFVSLAQVDTTPGNSDALTQTQTKPTFHYKQLLRQLSDDILAKEAIAKQRPNSWVHQERLASAYVQRGKLTGDIEDLMIANQMFDSAFDLAEGRGGPLLERAKLNFSLHRLSLVEPDLAQASTALLLNQSTQQEIDALRADIKLYSGDYRAALSAYTKLEEQALSVHSAARLSNYHAQTGNYPRATHWLEIAEARVVGADPLLRSWLSLQQGIIDLSTGDYAKANAHYEKALSQFPGYWLVEEHIAEIDVLQGRDDVAEVKYRDLIERTHSPMFMVALSEILERKKTKAAIDEADHWLSQAATRFNALLALSPESMSGHALGYVLQYETADRALELAQNNYVSRPGGEAAVLLAQAHIASNDPMKALSLVEKTLSSDYRSADLHATAYLIYAALNLSEQAATQQKLALAINPDAIDDIQWLGEPLTQSI